MTTTYVQTKVHTSVVVVMM